MAGTKFRLALAAALALACATTGESTKATAQLPQGCGSLAPGACWSDVQQRLARSEINGETFARAHDACTHGVAAACAEDQQVTQPVLRWRPDQPDIRPD